MQLRKFRILDRSPQVGLRVNHSGQKGRKNEKPTRVCFAIRGRKPPLADTKGPEPKMLNSLAGIRRMRTVVLTVAAALALLTSAPWTAAPAHATTHIPGRAASVGCYGRGCLELDPVQMGCNADAKTLAAGGYISTSQNNKIIHIELRYSRACNAMWARIFPAPANWTFYVQNWNQANNGGYNPEISWWTTTYVSDTVYGNMIDGSQYARACFTNGICTLFGGVPLLALQVVRPGAVTAGRAPRAAQSRGQAAVRSA